MFIALKKGNKGRRLAPKANPASAALCAPRSQFSVYKGTRGGDWRPEAGATGSTGSDREQGSVRGSRQRAMPLRVCISSPQLTMSVSCTSLASLPDARSASLTIQLTKPQNRVRVVLL